MAEMSDGIVSIPCEDAGDGKVVVNLDDYRKAVEAPTMLSGQFAWFRKFILDAYDLDPGVVGLDENYEMVYTEVEPIFPGTWAEVGQSPLEWAREHQGLRDRRGWWFWKMWFKGKRVVFAEWLYKCVSGDPFPTQDW